MKETTPSKFPHESGSVFNYIETHKPVVIKSRDHHDIIMILATDYLDMKAELDKFKWISVDDELPISNAEIIAATKRHGVQYGKYISYKKPTLWHNMNEYQFTHWMPMPKLNN